MKDFATLYSEEDRKVMKLAEDSLDPLIDRVDEIIAYAQEAGIVHLGIANCIAFEKDAAALQELLEQKGFKVARANCKYGQMPFKDILEGYKGLACNPAGQALHLAEEGSELNIMMGLCLGHDMVFNSKSTAPVTPLVVKDRKLRHATLDRFRALRS
ncbi:MAG: hypothetical protein CSA96_10290 [Bacteroidetes bacterium]|nr:MAG: hypothetical protein CSA96_10290 [Bacteroidota bacterium]